MHIGINCLSFCDNHQGGAESVLFNLCRGFYKLGISKRITFFVYEDMAIKLKEKCPDSEFVLFKKSSFGLKHKKICAEIIQTFVFYTIYKKYNLDLIFFPLDSIGVFKYKVPCIVLPHDIQDVSHPENYNRKWYRRILDKMSYYCDFRVADGIVAISDIDKDEIKQYYPKFGNKVRRIYDPIDVGVIKEYSFEKENYIIATNIQYKHKNVLNLIKAFDIIRKKTGLEYLYLVGALSSYTEELKKYVYDNDMTECVRFMGFMDKKELIDLWSKAKLYVNPSIYEGFGMTSVESIIMGVPTLLSDIPVNREVTHNLCMYCKNFLDDKSWAKCIEESILNPIDDQELIEKGKMLYKEYDYMEISRKYVSWFGEIIKNEK